MAPLASRPPSAFEPLVLIEAVREVAEASGLAKPQRISTRASDAARPLSERIADAPAARRICEHLGLTWNMAREIAFMPPRKQRIALGHARAVPQRAGRILAAGRVSARRQMRLPTDTDIVAVVDKWERGLVDAGLTPRPRGPGGPRVAPLSVLESRKPFGGRSRVAITGATRPARADKRR